MINEVSVQTLRLINIGVAASTLIPAILLFSALLKDVQNHDGEVKLVQMLLIGIYAAVSTVAVINAGISLATLLELPFANDSSLAFNATVNIRNLLTNTTFALVTWGFYLIRRKIGR
jgi:hypothetical protein